MAQGNRTNHRPNRGGFKAVPAEHRFWTKVEKTESCYNWTASLNENGYGIISVNRKPTFAHRFAWIMANGPIPDSLNVLHTCDNPRCVRIEHLFLGTRQDNSRDRDAKGRTARGERHGHSVLTEAQVLQVFSRRRNEGLSTYALAAEFGITRRSIADILSGKKWGYLTAEIRSAPS
jgi:hypothetical protein